ncbi:MAG: hypothetical protein R6V32_02395 [Bacteroidales bacterium]
MEQYLVQLLEDINAVKAGLKKPKGLFDEVSEYDIEDMLDESERYVTGDERPISEITGIDHKSLPAPEKLLEEQKSLMAHTLEDFLLYFHFVLEFPENYPEHLRYPFIRDLWQENHVPLSMGECHIEFCDYKPDNCPFPGYCSLCKDN